MSANRRGRNGVRGLVQTGAGPWILQADLWLNMMAIFVVLIGGREILRQAELADEEARQGALNALPRLVVEVSSKGLYFQEVPSEWTKEKPSAGLLTPFATLEDVLASAISGPTDELLLVLGCSEELPVKHLNTCLGIAGKVKGVTAVIKQTSGTVH